VISILHNWQQQREDVEVSKWRFHIKDILTGIIAVKKPLDAQDFKPS